MPNIIPIKLYAKLLKVQQSVDKLPKTGTNTHQKYKYLEASVLVEHMRRYLLDEGVLFFANVVDEEKEGKFAKVKMEFTLVDAESGEEMKSTFYGEGMDGGDKAYYKAYTGALKYFLVQTFMIPTGDDVEATSPEFNETMSIPYKPKAVPKKETEDQYFKRSKDLWMEQAGSMEGFDEWYANASNVHKNNKNVYMDLLRKIETRRKAAKG